MTKPQHNNYTRQCPDCGKDVHYGLLKNFQAALRENRRCFNCKQRDKAGVRQCPECNRTLYYSRASNCQQAERHGKLCSSCASKAHQSGSNNSFFGKHHSEETKQAIGKKNRERPRSEEERTKSRDNLAKATNTRPIYDIWLEKYGQEGADERQTELSIKRSKQCSGSGNPMFGKPSPNGSGNGWSGWYKGWFFRSLRELSYMINVIEAEQLEWNTANGIKIQYKDWEGKTRNYFPDFIINDEVMIEIKPAKLHKTPKVLAKMRAAEEYCKTTGMIYKLVDPVILSSDEIRKLYLDGYIKFLPRYEEKFKERYLKDR